MKALLLNGSPHTHGCVYTALHVIEDIMEQEGIDVRLTQIGSSAIHGCTACGFCKEGDGFHCVYNDLANELIDEMESADALIVGSPVYYGGPNGMLCALLDRMFFAGGKRFYGKPAAAVVSCRRSGGTAAINRLNLYFNTSNMPIVSSQYWNIVHGNKPDDVLKDEEGLQTMRLLARNMAAHIKASDHVKLPWAEKRCWTNFIR